MISKHNWLLVLILVNLILLVTGCVPAKKLKSAPVVEGWRLSAAGRNAYTVQKGDTLYSIAWAFGKDYRDLAQVNHLAPPYALRLGQKVYIATPAKPSPHKTLIASKTTTVTKATTVVVPATTTTTKPSKQPVYAWIWPAAGKVIQGYDSRLGGNKGIDIAGHFGDSVLASASGRVVYSGSGIRTYGNLIIIKHTDTYLSAYAHNSKMLVHEGQVVVIGQKIATMGNNDAGKILLHFEIRQNGKPINPLTLLHKKP